MKKLLLIFTFSVFSFQFSILTSFAQVTFQKVYGDAVWEIGLSAEPTQDNGYIIGGYTYSPLGDMELNLVKADSLGSIHWAKAYGSTSADAGRSVRQTFDRGYIAIGTTQGFGVAGYDVYAVRLNPSGDTLWSKTYGGGGDEIGYTGMETSEGGFIIAGVTNTGICLIKTNVPGDTLWTRNYGTGDSDVVNCIQQTSDMGYIMIGTTNGTGAGQNDVFLLRVDSSGTFLWGYTYGGSVNDEGFSVQQTNDGGFIAAGTSFSFGGESVYVIKTDSLGAAQWTKTYGGGSGDDGKSVRQTSDGGYIVCGTTFSFSSGTGGDVYGIKTDSGGAVQWSKTYGGLGYDYGYFVRQASDGGYAFAGYSASFGSGGYDFYLVKTDSAGNSGCYEDTASTVTGSSLTLSTPFVPVISAPLFTVRNVASVITPHGAEVTNCITTSVNEHSFLENLFSIYPNPAHSFFTVSFNGKLKMENGKLEIYDVMGREVYSDKIVHRNSYIVNQNFAPGLYFVKVSDGKNTFAGKFMIE